MNVTQSHVCSRLSSYVLDDNRMGINVYVGAILCSMVERGDVSPVKQQYGAPLEPTIKPGTEQQSD